MVDITDLIINKLNDRYKVYVFYTDSDGNMQKYIFKAFDIYKTDTDDLSIKNGNISDIEDLMLGNVRFVYDDLFVDIPLRNIYMFENIDYIKNINIKDMHGFSPININHVEVSYLNQIDNILDEILRLARDYYKMDRQEKFNTIKRINQLNNEYKETYK